jgi:intracellular multiplication protein IcmD
MVIKNIRKIGKLLFGAILFFGPIVLAYAGSDAGTSTGGAASGGIGSVAATAKGNLADIAKLITAASYIAGMAFTVGAVVKFKAHKDNPTQVAISLPIALLFVGAALMFIPSVFSSTGSTLFGAGGVKAGISGISSF